MTRNHIHLAQNVPGSGVISGVYPILITISIIILHANKTGMRNSSQILIFVDVQKALDMGIKFYLSANGVVLTEGNSDGFLSPEFFLQVENANGTPVQGWESSGPIVPAASVPTDVKINDAVTEGVKPAPSGIQ